jgi:hypothetical protein
MLTDVSGVLATSIIIALMMEAARMSETSVDIQLRTRQCIPEDSELHIRHRENLKSHKNLLISSPPSSSSLALLNYFLFRLYCGTHISLEYLLSRL